MAMVDAIISTLIQKLSAILEAQSEFENEFQVMKLRLHAIESFLGGLNEECVQQNLTKLRDLMYEADDLLTDYLIAEQYSRNGHSSNLFPPIRILFRRRQTSKKIQDINARLEELNDTFGNHVEEADKQEEQEQQRHFQTRISVSVDDDNDIIGLRSDAEKIKAWIFSPDSKLQKIGIVGMGELGKTTLARKIFEDSSVHKYFRKRVWVSVSQSFSGEKILRSILQQLGAAELVDEQFEDVNQMFRKIISEVSSKACLIVLDDLWETGLKWWMSFFSALPEHDCARSRIIITTRNKDVASSIQVDKIHQPNVLDTDESWSLFSKYAFPSKQDKELVQELRPVGEKIVAHCHGHPLAIKTVGGLLGSRDSSVEEWETICNNFHISNVQGENAAVMTSLRLSFEALPTHLKQCLLCFSVYPEDAKIPAENLVYWWVGEGFVSGASSSKTTIESGFEHLSQLISRCLVEVDEKRGYDGRVYDCKMHDLVRDLTLRMAEEEKMCFFDRLGRQILDKETRWLGFTTSEMDGNSLKLRALFAMANDKVTKLGSLRSLRVLDLSDNKLDNAALQNLLMWITSLKRLAYLNLSGAKYLEKVPDSICRLPNLQLLVLTGCCQLSKISPLITELKRLVVLDLSSCDKLQHLPRGMGKLSQLEQVSGFRFMSQENKRSCHFVDIEQLVELRVLKMSLSKYCKITENEKGVLSKLKKLQVLAINFDGNKLEGKEMAEMLEHISPPEGLKELSLRGYRHANMPTWFKPENFPNLAYLSIEDGSIFQICANDRTSSWNLEGLRLVLLPFLKHDWNKLREEMPLLCYAEVSGCKQIVNCPFPEQVFWTWRGTP